jgi:hypothetical protein
MLCRVAVTLTEKLEVATNGSTSRLEPVEVEVIHLFVQFSRAPWASPAPSPKSTVCCSSPTNRWPWTTSSNAST